MQIARQIDETATVAGSFISCTVTVTNWLPPVRPARRLARWRLSAHPGAKPAWRAEPKWRRAPRLLWVSMRRSQRVDGDVIDSLN